MSQAAPIAGACSEPTPPRSLWMGLFFAAAAALYTAAHFTGLEYHSGYYGNAYQAIHPNSFANDPYMAPGRPTMISLYYGLAKVVGSLWLDDRFTLFVYLGLAIAALVFTDKTIRCLGLQSLPERVAVLSLMLLEHRFKDNHANLVSLWDFNPTTLAGPVAIALIYLIVSGRGGAAMLPVMALLSALSMKNAWFPILFGLTVLFRDRLSARRKIVAAASAGIVISLSLSAYYLFWRPSGMDHPAVFDYIIRYMDNSEANPFLDTFLSNVLFGLLSMGGLLIRLPDAAVERRVKTAVALGIFIWLAGGCYLSWAPDILKIPYVVPFDVNRALWWPQYLSYLALGVFAVRRLREASRPQEKFIGAAILLALLLTPFKPKVALAATALSIAAPAGILLCRRLNKSLFREPWRQGTALVLAGCVLAVLGTKTVQRRSAFSFLVRHGILGDNPGAKWVGVNEYLRDQTSPPATVFALSLGDYPWRPKGLRYDQSVKIRGGRPMQIGHDVSFHFDLLKLQWNGDRNRRMDALVAGWNQRDAATVREGLAFFNWPDVLVVPASEAAWLAPKAGWPYRMDARINDFTLWRKNR